MKTNFRFQISNFKYFNRLIAALFIFQCFIIGVSAQIAVKAETLWTMTNVAPISNGVVLIKDGKIEAVGTESQIKIPSNYRIISAKIVTPGLIDAHSVIGLAGYMNQPHDQMQVDNSSPMQPELRAIDAYNPEEKLIEWVREFGVTTIHTGHAPAALISGQTMIVKTFGKTAEENAIELVAMISVTLGQGGLESGGKSPGTRAKQAAMLRSALLKAQESVRKSDSSNKTSEKQNNNNTSTKKDDISPNVSNPDSMLKKPPTPAYRDESDNVSSSNSSSDLRADIMEKVIRREIPLLITAQKAQDIMTALRIAKEFNIKIVLDGAAEAHLVMDEIKKSGFPVILHPTMYRAGGETENLSFEMASKLKANGINFALQSGYETYVPKTRVVLFEAALAAANGLSRRDALASITIDAAKLLGIDRQVGSLERGKDADLAMYDGDPFEYTTHCIGTIINGKVVSETNR